MVWIVGQPRNQALVDAVGLFPRRNFLTSRGSGQSGEEVRMPKRLERVETLGILADQTSRALDAFGRERAPAVDVRSQEIGGLTQQPEVGDLDLDGHNGDRYGTAPATPGPW